MSHKEIYLSVLHHYLSHLRLTLAHLDSLKPAGKAALLTFPNKSRFSLC
jgi:hypothetical protein